MTKRIRNKPHREMVYDPQHSTRRFKRFHEMSTSGHAAHDAYSLGLAVGQYPLDVPKRWRTNRYPPGRRHDLYEQGKKDAVLIRDEERTYRRWNS
jgi:hypothetical protein